VRAEARPPVQGDAPARRVRVVRKLLENRMTRRGPTSIVRRSFKSPQRIRGRPLCGRWIPSCRSHGSRCRHAPIRSRCGPARSSRSMSRWGRRRRCFAAVMRRVRPPLAVAARQIVLAVGVDAQDDRTSALTGRTEDVDPQHRSVPGANFRVAVDHDVGGRVGDGNRGIGDTAKPCQGITQGAGASPRPVQRGRRLSGHAAYLRSRRGGGYRSRDTGERDRDDDHHHQRRRRHVRRHGGGDPPVTVVLRQFDCKAGSGWGLPSPATTETQWPRGLLTWPHHSRD
jgi:hypothetical protein